jgi:hypothetical protein
VRGGTIRRHEKSVVVIIYSSSMPDGEKPGRGLGDGAIGFQQTENDVGGGEGGVGEGGGGEESGKRDVNLAPAGSNYLLSCDSPLVYMTRSRSFSS